MTAKVLEKALVLETLHRTKSKRRAATELGISTETLRNLLVEWNEQVSFANGRHITPNVDLHQRGDLVYWRPNLPRRGFYGFPEGIETWPVRIVRGPTKANYYDVAYAGPNKSRRIGTKTYHVMGSRLFKEAT